jgi:hypothetical protein
MKTLGFVGTAKNTGKTTTALHILNLVNAAGIRTALTSIGFDGENTDHVTGLPKPRYYAEIGMLLATATRLLEVGTAQYGNIQPTGLKTILGEIVIATVTEPGYVVVAGPNRKVDIKTLLGQLAGLGVELTMVDGALNRLAAMVLADGMVLSTGASFDERIDVIADHAAAMESLFHHPHYPRLVDSDQSVVRYLAMDGKIDQLDISSVLDEFSMQQVACWLIPGQAGECFIPGVFGPQLFRQMVERYPERLAGKSWIFTSPLNLLASADPEIWRTSIRRLKELGAQVSYITPIPLHFMTVNPFYPRYLQKTGHYVAEFVDKVELLQSVRSGIQDTLVVDILQPPHPDLLAQCGLSSSTGGNHES